MICARTRASIATYCNIAARTAAHHITVNRYTADGLAAECTRRLRATSRPRSVHNHCIRRPIRRLKYRSYLAISSTNRGVTLLCRIIHVSADRAVGVDARAGFIPSQRSSFDDGSLCLNAHDGRTLGIDHALSSMAEARMLNRPDAKEVPHAPTTFMEATVSSDAISLDVFGLLGAYIIVPTPEKSRVHLTYYWKWLFAWNGRTRLDRR